MDQAYRPCGPQDAPPAMPSELSDERIEQFQDTLAEMRKHLLHQNGLFTGREVVPRDQFGLKQLVRTGWLNWPFCVRGNSTPF
jgi:hypothetical protein